MKDRKVGKDSFGQVVYKTAVRHHSMARLYYYCKCAHFCLGCHKDWVHKMAPDLACPLFYVHSDCENCLTYGFNVSTEDKIKLMAPHHQEILRRWKQKHGKSTKSVATND